MKRKAESGTRYRKQRSISPGPRAAAAALGVAPSKGRGQNFLVQASVASKIVAGARLEADDEVVEIGPGLGILTEHILKYPVGRLRLIEIEDALAENLRKRLSSDTRASVIVSDFLELDFASAIERPPVKVLGNLPFNSAAAILRRLDAERALISRMVLMFQREVAERIRAQPGDEAYGALSVFTALYWRIASHFRVEAGNFQPRPKVDAEVLIFEPRAAWFDAALEPSILRAIKAAFSTRRKTLRNALTFALGGDRQDAELMLEQSAIPMTRRAEELAVEDFVRLGQALYALERSKSDA